MLGTLGLFYFVLGGKLCHFFNQGVLKPIFPIRGNIRHALYHCRWPFGNHSGAMRLLATSCVMPDTLGLFYFALGGELCHFFNQSVFLPIRGNVRHCLYRRPWPSGICSGTMLPLSKINTYYNQSILLSFKFGINSGKDLNKSPCLHIFVFFLCLHSILATKMFCQMGVFGGM